MEPRKYCECGCGGLVRPGRRFINHHHWKGESHPLLGKKGKDHPRFGEKRSEEFIKNMSGENNHMYGKKGKDSPSYGLKRSEETLRNASKTMEAIWKDPEYVKKQMKSRNVKQNKVEKKLEKILNDLFPDDWKFVGDGELIISGKCPDFVNVNGQKKLIEVYGDYWHRNDNPEDRIKIFEPFGYKTLVIWERELKDIKNLRKKLMLFDSQ